MCSVLPYTVPPSWTKVARIVNRIAVHAVAFFAVSYEKSWRVIANASKSSRKSYLQSTRTHY